jgi:CHAT domain-containing protein/Tfp pilus assembly protein PilF
MPIAWLRSRSAFVFFLYFPWFPLPPLPPAAQAPAVTVGSGTAGESQTAASAPEEPLVLPGVVIEEIPKGSALEKAGVQVGDVILSWERLPNPPANPEGASGKISSPFDWMWLEIEQAPRGVVRLTYVREGSVSLAHVSEGYWGTTVTSWPSGSAVKRFAALKSQLEDAKGEISFANVHESLEPHRKNLSPEVQSSQLLAIGDVYARFSRWEDANRAYQEALLGIDSGLFRTMIISSVASLYSARNMIDEAISFSNQASDQYRTTGADILLARELQRLAKLYVTHNTYPQAIKALDEAVKRLEERCPGSLAQASVLNSRGVLRRELRDLSGARSDHEAALFIYRNLAPCSSYEASALLSLGNLLYIQDDLSQAEKAYREALAIHELTSPESLLMAKVLTGLALVFDRRGENEEALLKDEHALIIRLALAPDSLAVADSLNSIGLTYKDIGKLWVAESFLEESLRIRSTLIPGSLTEAQTVSNLGLIALKRDEFDRAINLFSQACQRLQHLPNGKLALAGTLGNLGTAYLHKGDIVVAEKFLTESFEMLKSAYASNFELGTILLNLGNISYARADYELAGERYREAARLFAVLGKHSHEASVCLANLASIAHRTQRFEEASALYKESLAIEEKLAPHGAHISNVLANMGLLSLEAGRLSEAENLTSRALLIKRKYGQPLEATAALINLGEIAMARQKYDKALDYYNESLRIISENKGRPRELAEALFNLGWLHKEIGDYDRARNLLLEAQEASKEWANGTWFEAEIEHALGSIANRLGETNAAEEAFSNAVATLEEQMTRFDPQPSDRRQFREKYREFYGSLLEILISKGNLRDAFAVSERGRGRSFLETLSVRRLETGDYLAPQAIDRPDLGAIEARKMQISQALSTEAKEQAEPEMRRRNVEKLLSLRQEYNATLRDLDKNYSRLTALQGPKPLDADATAASLEPKTVLLSYWVNVERSFLFVLNSEGALHVHSISIDQNSLKDRIWRLRSLINEAASKTVLGEFRNREVKRLGGELYQLLIYPAEDQIKAAERVLIVPDGPLHYLPFGVLVRKAPEKDGVLRDQYLAEWQPFHSVLSATLYTEIKKERRPATESVSTKQRVLDLIAFGDPRFPTEMSKENPDSVSDLRVRSAVRHGAVSLEPLYFSRREVEGILTLFPPEAVQIFLGVDATEERAKAVGKGTRILHFATHARLDDRLPLDSALVLTIPQGFPSDRDNGLLQVWEIFEKVRLDADLVVLSGCETALGEEHSGEGLIGLTRAFQYAGARTVMASLWSVQDQATSELMIRFYKHLRAGKSKDEALRQAQMDLIRGPIEVVNEKGEKTLFDASAPYYWAGFQVYGDWQ